jgi:hypothetical protein
MDKIRAPNINDLSDRLDLVLAVDFIRAPWLNPLRGGLFI